MSSRASCLTRRSAGKCLKELGVRIHNPQPIPMTVSDPHFDMHGSLVTDWVGEPVNAAPEEQVPAQRPRSREDGPPESLSSILSAVRVATDHQATHRPP